MELAPLGRRLNIMRRPILLPLLLLMTPSLASAAGVERPVIRVVNEAKLSAAQIVDLQRDFGRWAERVYAFNHVQNPKPVNLVITRKVGIGYYYQPNVYLPADDDNDEMLETWVHELAHHATGHESSFFFKEGIASLTLEALFAKDGRTPQGWPQYGEPLDAWVSLFDRRGQLPALRDVVAREGYDGSTREGDYRSWQVYVIAGSFLGWLIKNEGYESFRTVFWAEGLGLQGAEWERRWLASIRAQRLPSFDVAAALPSGSRYRYFAKRVSG